MIQVVMVWAADVPSRLIATVKKWMNGFVECEGDHSPPFPWDMHERKIQLHGYIPSCSFD
jgi:hypothetical protein